MRQTLPFPKVWRVVLDMRQWVSDVIATYDVGRAQVRFEYGAEAVNVIRVGVQVIDRQGRDVKEAWEMVLIVGTAATGEPGGTQTVASVTGYPVLAILTANQVAKVETNASGLHEVDITVAGAGTRYVSVSIDGEVHTSRAVTWV